ncbi:MAG TPA: hypothetical protein VF981_10915 [Gemmatimonadaceae bacterium]
MRRFTSAIAAVVAVTTLGCSHDPVSAVRLVPEGPMAGLGALNGSVTGRGRANLSVGPMDIEVMAKQHDDGTAKGTFRHFIVTSTGTIDFTSEVTCLAVDAALGRAWLGGKVLTNNSTRPDFITSITEPGDEIWFRLADLGEGGNASAPDRSTGPGFEGSLGFITSAEYCAARVWPNEPVLLVSGNLQVHD